MTIEELAAAWNANADAHNQWGSLGYDEMVEFALNAEREACAQVCENNTLSWLDAEWNSAVLDCAERIRARGERAKEAGNDFPKPRRQHVPCGECQLQPGERCDICGAVEPDEQAKEK